MVLPTFTCDYLDGAGCIEYHTANIFGEDVYDNQQVDQKRVAFSIYDAYESFLCKQYRVSTSEGRQYVYFSCVEKAAEIFKNICSSSNIYKGIKDFLELVCPAPYKVVYRIDLNSAPSAGFRYVKKEEV